MANGETLELMVRYLLTMQFYNGNGDFLYSRDMNHKIPIPGIGEVMTCFIKDVLRHIHLIVEKKYHLFLEEVSKAIPFEIDFVEHSFHSNVNELQLTKLTDLLAVNFLVGPIREYIQKRAFDECIAEVTQRAGLVLDDDNSDLSVRKRLEHLYSTSDPIVSMLYNLTLLRFLAKKYGADTMQSHVEKIVMKYCDLLFQKLTQS